MNINKTIEMVIDFRNKRTQPQGTRGEVVAYYSINNLGVVIGNRLDWKLNTEAMYKKGMSRHNFLRKLGS